MLARAVLIFLAVCSLGAEAAAEDGYGATAVVRKHLAATHGEDASAAGTSLELDNRVTTPRSLGDVIREAPGARVANTGGLGAFSSVSLRGADAEETLVLLDEIPLVTADGGAFDFSLFPVELFERVDVFRGGAPVWLGSGAIGGVVRLVPRDARKTAASASIGGGSFGTYQLDAAAEVATASGVSTRSHVVLRGTQGNYRYRDDKGTLWVPEDDETRTRKNAELTDASGFTDLKLPLWGGQLHVLALGTARSAGFPGPASQPTPKVHRQYARFLVATAYERRAGGGGSAPKRRIQAVLSTAYGADRYTDVFGQLGTSKQTATDDHTLRVFARLAGTLRLARWIDATLVSSYALDRRAPFNKFAFPQTAASTRHTGAAALELNLRHRIGQAHFELRPSVRLEWSSTELHTTTSASGPFEATRTVTAPTARLGGVIEPVNGLALSASVATGTRLPTMFELFGDRGLTLPSVHLKPVTSTTYDGGITFKDSWDMLRAALELRGFYQERRNAIAMFRTAQWQVGHENLSAVNQYGVEAGLSAGVSEYASLYGSFTWLQTENALGKRLPFRPQYVSFVRPELSFPFSGRTLSGLSVATEIGHRSYTFVDRANLAYAPACLKAGVGAAATLFGGRVRVAARVDDVADARCSDLIGYPLPGRAYFLSVTYQEMRRDAI